MLYLTGDKTHYIGYMVMMHNLSRQVMCENILLVNI